uniref:Immunoglobulin V-set domain-containing protein n=1 Tax=Amphiprion percula TaxID=161767 RepID=A0A3P8S1J7_AMPPE
MHCVCKGKKKSIRKVLIRLNKQFLFTLDIVGHVGKNVTVECSDWNVWTNVNFNVKYLCESPCSEDKHIIIKAEYGQTKNNNRIELTNRENGLFVTFTNLTMSDSRKYYCGVERYGHDSFIEVNLNITDSELPGAVSLVFVIFVSSVSVFTIRTVSHCSTSSIFLQPIFSQNVPVKPALLKACYCNCSTSVLPPALTD